MFRRAAAVLLLTTSLLAALPGRGAPLDRERDLKALRAEIAELETRLGAARSRERSLATLLAEADLELELQSRRVAEARAAHDLAAERARAAAAEVARLELELAQARAAVRKRVVGLYRLGREGPLRLALSARPGSDLGASIRLLRYLARRDGQAVERYVEARGRSRSETERLDAERAAEAEWLRQEEVRRAELAAVQKRQAQLVRQARAEEATLTARAGALAEKERRLSALVDALYEGAAEALGGRSILDFRGALDWPLEGRVTQEFGSRLDPRYRTRTPHRGLEITAADGTGVRAVYPGKVLFAAPFEGYGPTVVVHHTDRVFSLYAGLAQLSVKKGDVLQLADPVGLATGPLYFEIRRENRPEDPRGWLR